MSYHEATTDFRQFLAELRDRLKLKLRPQDSTLLDVVGFDCLVEEPRIEAEDRQNLGLLGLWLGCSPVEDHVVMQAQIVAEPQDNSMH